MVKREKKRGQKRNSPSYKKIDFFKALDTMKEKAFIKGYVEGFIITFIQEFKKVFEKIYRKLLIEALIKKLKEIINKNKNKISEKEILTIISKTLKEEGFKMSEIKEIKSEIKNNKQNNKRRKNK